MTSTPVSLDDSLNGSWIDINSASQIHSPMDDEPDFAKLQKPNYALAGSVISFQVERFLQEAQRNQTTSTGQSNVNNNSSPMADDLSGIYLSDSDTPVEGYESLISNLKKKQQHLSVDNGSNNNTQGANLKNKSYSGPRNSGLGLSKSGECLLDQLSDSLSLLSRASCIGHEQAVDGPSGTGGRGYNDTVDDFGPDFEWLWDWTAQPEYFTGQEWKVYAPKQDHLMRQRQLYCATLNKNPNEQTFSGEVLSLLFLTNILSIIIGAGLTYSILMRRPNDI